MNKKLKISSSSDLYIGTLSVFDSFFLFWLTDISLWKSEYKKKGS